MESTDRYPHRARLRALLVKNRDTARADIATTDPYGAKQLERYANDMQKQIDNIDSMREDYAPDPE